MRKSVHTYLAQTCSYYCFYCCYYYSHYYYYYYYYYTVSQKVPIIKLLITLSNLDRFSKFFHCWKAVVIVQKQRWGNATFSFGPLTMFVCLSLAL